MAVQGDQRALLMTRASLCSWFRTDCRQCGSNPGSPAAFSRGQNGLRTAVSGKLNLLKKTTFYDLRVSEFTSALSLVRGGNRYNVSEVKDRRDRSNELYEQVAALA